MSNALVTNICPAVYRLHEVPLVLGCALAPGHDGDHWWGGRDCEFAWPANQSDALREAMNEVVEPRRPDGGSRNE